MADAGLPCVGFAVGARAPASARREYRAPAGSAAWRASHDRYREVIGHFPTGVAVVTLQGPTAPRASPRTPSRRSRSSRCCCSSASTTPRARCPRSGQRALRRQRARAGQEELARVFASKRVAAREVRGRRPTRVAHGVPVLDGALAWLACDLRELHPGRRPHDRDRRGHAHGRAPGGRRCLPRAALLRSTRGVASRPRARQRQERDDERGDRHHADLAAHDRRTTRALPSSGSAPTPARPRGRARRAPSAPRASRSCSAMNETATGSRT